ncbi:hypothetical protein E1281_39830, partial [Actinomadura sp. KC345]|uniref:hypothetical protein n=1 Tax=Actinomadura sp. KC345 TaxID=2530371 RepID=UPI0010EFDDA2
VEQIPGTGDPKPVWLWSSRTGACPQHVDRLWQAFLRRFDLEHWSAPGWVEALIPGRVRGYGTPEEVLP